MSDVSTFITGKPTPKKLGNDIITVQNRLSFATTNVAANDVVAALKVPKGAYVFRVITRVQTAEGGTLTFDVGDGAAAAGYDNDVDGNATAGTVASSVAGTDSYAEGKFYAADDTIDLTMNHAADAAVIDIEAAYFIMESVANA